MNRQGRNNLFLIFFIIPILLYPTSTLASDRVEFQGEAQPIITKPAPGPSKPSKLVGDMIIIKFKPFIAKETLESMQERIFSGIPSIDTLTTKYRIQKIWKQFPGKMAPKIPADADLSRIYKVKFPSGFNPEEVASEFSKEPNVEYAQAIGVHPVYATTPDDTYFVQQWSLAQRKDHDVDGPQAWDIGQGSSNVALAVVDTGVDWHHPDLATNIWVNPGEDLNGNGVVDPSDYDNKDNDGNGFKDDIVGWDWIDGVTAWPGEDKNTPDNDPMDFNGHGTHCAGIASAVTNNGTGVAGLGWSCKIMALRAGWSGRYLGQEEVGYVRMDFCAEAIVYAANKGAIAVNCSWGSSNSGGIADAVNYAISKGVLVVVAAGNDDSSTPDYLASRGDCIDIAATDPDDKKSSFSNYGSWVDLSAPGTNILSTYYDHNTAASTYAIMSGTSMSAPQVVGLIGLLKAYQPTLSATHIKAAIFNSADNINAVNPGYTGQLGTGRANAYSALLGSEGIHLACYDMSIDDSVGGNNNQRPDPGETDTALTIILKNMGISDVTGISAELTSTDPFITINSGSSNFPDLLAGATGNSLTAYTFDVASSCFPGHLAEFSLNISANSGTYTRTDTFKLRIGRPPILIWDHDDGDLPFNGNKDEFTLGDGEEAPFEVSLENLGYEFETLFALPSDLTGYQAIVVVLGYYSGNETLMSSSEQTRLINFMDAGGDVYIEGLDFGYDYSTTTLYSYFHCNFDGDGDPASTGNVSTLNGTASAITTGMSFAYDYKGAPDHYVDKISAKAEATLIWKDQNNIGRGVSYNTGGSSQRVHTSTMLGGMTDGTTPSTRDEYLSRLFLNFFGISPTPVPVLGVTVSPAIWPIGPVGPGSTTPMSEADDITVTNNGTIVETFSLAITSVSCGWTTGFTPGSEEFVMKGLFCGLGDTPGANLFKDDDVILMGSPSLASDTQYGEPSLSDNGVNVAPLSSVDLWLQFQAPTETAETTEQTIVVTVGAHAP